MFRKKRESKKPYKVQECLFFMKRKGGQMKILSIIFMLIFSLISVSALTNITNWTGLDAMRNNLSEDYVLLNDLTTSDLDYETFNNHSSSGWLPIGNSTVGYMFNGTFDGQNHTIDGLFINRTTDHVGFFGYTKYSTISNIGLTNVYISGNSNVGSLVGLFIISSLVNSYATGNVNGSSFVGGLVGVSEGYALPSP